ncbi:MAG TPA: phosphate signaling complex protein PhoU [Chloroflexota bacterium]|jgi:phosphate transport system protein|nr:phosphate signaling complex protein PhoU [Chloroflexota bacterium]
MIRHTFIEALQLLQDDLLSMGAAVEKQIEESVDALKGRDVRAAERIAARDSEIDRMRYDIEEHCIELFATQNPMASDLRTVTSALIVSNELERMGDYAEGICKLTIKLGAEPPLKPLIDIPRMSEIAQSMLKRSLQAFVDRDAQAARQIWGEDDLLDDLYQQILRELLTYMLEQPNSVTRATYLLWVAHNLERIGDRVSNIAERVIFMATGQLEGYALRPPEGA